MNLIKLTAFIISLIYFNGCSTATVIYHAQDQEMRTKIWEVNSAFKNKNNIYVCFDGVSTPINRSKGLDGKDKIIRNNEVLEFRTKELKPRDEGFKQKPIESNRIVSTSCSTYSNTNKNSKNDISIYKINIENTHEADKTYWRSEENESIHGNTDNSKLKANPNFIIDHALSNLEENKLATKNIIFSTKKYAQKSKKHDFKYQYNSLYYVDDQNNIYSLRAGNHTYKNGLHPLYLLIPVTVAVDIVTLPIQLLIVKNKLDNAF